MKLCQKNLHFLPFSLVEMLRLTTKSKWYRPPRSPVKTVVLHKTCASKLQNVRAIQRTYQKWKCVKHLRSTIIFLKTRSV